MMKEIKKNGVNPKLKGSLQTSFNIQRDILLIVKLQKCFIL